MGNAHTLWFNNSTYRNLFYRNSHTNISDYLCKDVYCIIMYNSEKLKKNKVHQQENALIR